MDTHDCLCTSLRQAARRSTEFYDRVLAPSGLTVTMFRLIRQIDAHAPISVSALAQVLELDRSTLGRNLGVVEKMGFIQRLHGDDERVRAVTLTEHGQSALAEALPLWGQAQERMQSILEPELDGILRALTRLNDPRVNAEADSYGDQ